MYDDANELLQQIQVIITDAKYFKDNINNISIVPEDNIGDIYERIDKHKITV
jgi:hypothetical protein